MLRFLLIAAVLITALAGCSLNSGSNGNNKGNSGSSEPVVITGTVPQEKDAQVPPDTPSVSALSVAGEAGRLASTWRPDAKLYAIAALTPVGVDGKAQGWLFTYVSESAGSTASISVVGGKPDLDPALGIQQLPRADIQNILRHILPPPGSILDSTQAMQQAQKVRGYLESNPKAEVSMGLDSFSSPQPIWIITTIEDKQRVEERINALSK